MNTRIDADVYIVDVCGTLVHDDTTLGLLRHHFSRDKSRPLRRWVFAAVGTRWTPIWFAFVLAEKLTGRHLLKHFAVRLLAGDNRKAVDQSAREYAERLLTERRVTAVWSLIERPLADGTVVFASASLEPVVSALAISTGAGYVASSLECREGALTGRYEADLTGRKKTALVAKYGNEFLSRKVCVVTDNVTDRPLIVDAEYSYVVLHDAAHHKRWSDLDVTFIGLGE